MSGYKKIREVGPNEYMAVNNPLTYCVGSQMDNMFAHGGNAQVLGKDSRSCHLYMSQYCANKWDKFCDVVADDRTGHMPPMGSNGQYGLSSGQNHVRATAEEKYLVSMPGCVRREEPFDPTVATSPMVKYWSEGCGSSACTPSYAVDASTIDDDPVMTRMLDRPGNFADILQNIFWTMQRQGTLQQLKGTSLGKFYSAHSYFKTNGW